MNFKNKWIMSKKEILTWISETQAELAEAKAQSAEVDKYIREQTKKSDDIHNRIETRLNMLSTIIKDRCNAQAG